MQQPDFKHFIVNTYELFQSLVKYEATVDSDVICYDLETNSEIELKATVYGIGLCFTELKGFYIPMVTKEGVKVWSAEHEKEIVLWLEQALKARQLIGHNIIYDVLVTEYNYGFILDDYIHADTILMKHTLDEERPFGLKEIAPIILGAWATLAQDKLEENVKANGGRFTKDYKDMYLADTHVLGEYCCWDVLLTLLLYRHFSAALDKEGLTKFFYEDEVMPLYKEVTINMKRKGFPIDVSHFQNLKKDLELEITTLEDEIHNEIKHHVDSFEQSLLDDKYPVKFTGNFPKFFAEEYALALPVTKDNKITLAKKAIEAQKAASIRDMRAVEFYDWLLAKDAAIAPVWINEGRRPVQEAMYFSTHPEKTKIFNLSSGDHIGHLLYNCLGITPFKFTDSKKPSTDKEVMDELIEQYKTTEPWMSKLSDYRKLSKLLSTYVDGILDRQINGVIYTSMLQFGTTSGRYASTNPNLQNQPRIKEEDSDISELVLKYSNQIKKGFISGAGRKVVNADYSSLEPVCFAHMSGDQKLRDVFINGLDLYSVVGIETFDLQGVSPDKKAPNYLKNIMPEMRQKAKEFVLMIPYGAEEGQISKKMNVTWQEATEIKDKYLNKFPGLQKYMNRCNYLAKTQGIAKTELGRIRHIKEARSIHTLFGDRVLNSKWAKANGHSLTRSKLRNLLNNAKNFPIQGLAAHIVNRAMISTAKAFKANGIDGYVALQVHDELTCIVAEHQADLAAKLLRDCMEKTTTISVPLSAEPLIADNWADAK